MNSAPTSPASLFYNSPGFLFPFSLLLLLLNPFDTQFRDPTSFLFPEKQKRDRRRKNCKNRTGLPIEVAAAASETTDAPSPILYILYCHRCTQTAGRERRRRSDPPLSSRGRGEGALRASPSVCMGLGRRGAFLHKQEEEEEEEGPFRSPPWLRRRRRGLQGNKGSQVLYRVEEEEHR